jgi:uncharacterized membrane protein
VNQKMTKKVLLSSALLLASLELQTQAAGTASSTPSGQPKTDAIGKCYGVVGKGQGDCSGKNPATGESWGCSGGNPTADLGYKEMKESECKAAPQHKEAKKKSFEAYKTN